MANADYRNWIEMQSEKIESVKTGLLAVVQRQQEIKSAMLDIVVVDTEDGSHFDSNVHEGKYYFTVQGVMVQSVGHSYHIVQVPEWFGGVAIAINAERDQLAYDYYNYEGKMDQGKSVKGLLTSTGIHVG